MQTSRHLQENLPVREFISLLLYLLSHIQIMCLFRSRARLTVSTQASGSFKQAIHYVGYKHNQA
jgi:hypothetical protein